MKLKLIAESTGQTWTLKPDRGYTLGNSHQCEIVLSHPDIAPQHIQIKFDVHQNCWLMITLDHGKSTMVNGYPVMVHRITSACRMGLGNQVFLKAEPVLETASPTTNSPGYGTQPKGSPQPLPSSLQPSPTSGFYPNQNPSLVSSEALQQRVQIRSLSWQEYIQGQVEAKTGFFNKIATHFYLTTGLRNTPWLRSYGRIGFDALEGYVLPNLLQYYSLNQILDQVYQEFLTSTFRQGQYFGENPPQFPRNSGLTCQVVRLTDAHLTNSATKVFLGIELFAINRGGQPDYRTFLIMAYHRIRTYVLVEGQGQDVLIHWVTRFEPDPSPIHIQVFFFISLVCLLLLNPIPIMIWITRYMTTPYVMESLNILPKGANAYLVMTIQWLLLLPLLTLLMNALVQQFLNTVS